MAKWRGGNSGGQRRYNRSARGRGPTVNTSSALRQRLARRLTTNSQLSVSSGTPESKPQVEALGVQQEPWVLLLAMPQLQELQQLLTRWQTEMLTGSGGNQSQYLWEVVKQAATDPSFTFQLTLRAGESLVEKSSLPLMLGTTELEDSQLWEDSEY